MRILLTNNGLAMRAGSELYIRDLCLALMKRGHFPVAYSTVLGQVADELRQATIPVIDDLSALNSPPDVIHGQHHLETMTAALHFPTTPVVYACHGWLPWQEMPPVFPTLRHYVAVDDLCRERLLTTKGIAVDQVEVIYNFVDLEQFTLRAPLPSTPTRALFFTNNCPPNHPSIAAIRAACQRFHITQVDVIGLASHNPVTTPEKILGAYDVVFAKARCALEAIASGCAVIVTDAAGLGEYVSMDNVARLRRLNFGIRTLQTATLTEANIFRALSKYNAADAMQTSHYIRQQADLTTTINAWLAIYERLQAERPKPLTTDALATAQLMAASHYLRVFSPIIKARTSDIDPTEVVRRLANTEAELIARKAELAQREAELLTHKAELTAQQESVTTYQTKLAQQQATLLSCQTALTQQQENTSHQQTALVESQTQQARQQAALTTIYDSLGWKTITRYRKLRRWVLRIKS